MSRRIAVTLGDPSGIGPEILAAAWNVLKDEISLLLVGDPAPIMALGVPVIPHGGPTGDANTLPAFPVPLSEPAQPGQIQPANAAATIRAIEIATELAQSGEVAAIVTNPINKKVLVDGAGFEHPGHTEFLAALDGKDRSVMMLAGPDLRVIPTTIHIPLSRVQSNLTPTLLEETIRIAAQALTRDFGIAAPRLAVAGLNPHAGEGGLMGTEEIDWIGPLLQRLNREDLTVMGPMSADTMFHARARQTYDAAICMYHDQALIPIKTLAFDEGVNCTLGLSFIRTSPDHGTAYDIAGTGAAKPDSLIAAIRMAASMAANRNG